MEEKHPLYATSDLISLFKQLAKDGYSGLSMGLITDLIERDCKDITEGKEIEWQTATKDH
jgi:hypothetical protein